MWEAGQYVSCRARLSCEGLIAKLPWLCLLIQSLHRNRSLSHPAQNTIPLLCRARPVPVQDFASQRRTNTFRRLLFGLCNSGSLPCVRDERFVCECRTNRPASPPSPPPTSPQVHLPHNSVLSQLRKFREHWKPILGLKTHLFKSH